MWLSEKQLVSKRKEDYDTIHKLQYRENDYFNEKDYFLIYDIGLNKFISSRVILYNGNYYSEDGMKYKMSSVKSVKCKNLI